MCNLNLKARQGSWADTHTRVSEYSVEKNKGLTNYTKDSHPSTALLPALLVPGLAPLRLGTPCAPGERGRGCKVVIGRGRARDAQVGCGVHPVSDKEQMRGRGARGEGGEGAVWCTEPLLAKRLR